MKTQSGACLGVACAFVFLTPTTTSGITVSLVHAFAEHWTTYPLVAVADFDRDGTSDLVVCNAETDSCMVLLQRDFDYFDDFPTSEWRCDLRIGPSTIGLAAADLNEDELPDLVSLSERGVKPILRRPDGTWSEGREVAAGCAPHDLAVGDLNLDGNVDVAVASDSVRILWGDGRGGFGGQAVFGDACWPSILAIGRLEEDGRPGLVAASPRIHPPDRRRACGLMTPVSCDWPTGRLALADGTPVVLLDPEYDGSDPQAMAIEDLNGDRKSEILVAAGRECTDPTNAVLVFSADNLAQNSGPRQFDVGYFPTSLAVADLDRSGRPDFAANSIHEGTVSIFLNPGSDSSESILVVLPLRTVPYAVLAGEWGYPGFSGLAIVCDDGIRMIALRP